MVCDVLCDEPLTVILERDVSYHDDGLEAFAGRLESLRLARGESERVALVRQHAGDRESDSGRAAGDERGGHLIDPRTERRPPGGRRPSRAVQRRGGEGYDSPPPSSVPPPRLLPGRAYTDFVTGSPTLTSLARAGGCAAKYPAARLEKLLAGFVPVDSEDLLVGLDPADDAAVYRLDDERALVFTVDFFPPVVDDPRAFGAIAATNALNDVFAMGGVPLLALSITAFPEELPTETLGEILAGADEVVRAAGAILAGGHTIRDDEPKYGLAVVGTVHPDGIWPKSGAKPGDAVFLTKSLGTGLVLQAEREGRAPAGALAAAVAAMRTLNRDAADALRPFGPNAVTDVTGFGLLGHAYEMASRSGRLHRARGCGATRPSRRARARDRRCPHRGRPA